jgi:hypothetical protein
VVYKQSEFFLISCGSQLESFFNILHTVYFNLIQEAFDDCIRFLYLIISCINLGKGIRHA